MATTHTQSNQTNGIRFVIIAVLVLGAFFGAYRYAAARNGAEALPGQPAEGLAFQQPAGSAAGGAGCACCGSTAPTENGLTGPEERGEAVVTGDVQTIEVDLSQGLYSPNAIVLKAGVPAEITFGQGSGCLAQVMSQELGFYEDLTGGPRTVKLPALEAGEYPFYCGMKMVFGKIVVE